ECQRRSKFNATLWCVVQVRRANYTGSVPDWGRRHTALTRQLWRGKMHNYRRWLTVAATVGIAAVVASPVAAQKKYDPGASDREIKIGNTVPYSGPASAYGEIGKTFAAYFNKVNAEGGVNGRKITFISYDDAYSPPKAVEQTRKLVESDEVLL